MDDLNTNREPMVTIPLGEYNRLRDGADLQRLLIDRIMALEVRTMDMDRRINDLSFSKADR